MTSKIFLRIVHFFYDFTKKNCSTKSELFCLHYRLRLQTYQKSLIPIFDFTSELLASLAIMYFKNETSFAFSDRNMHLQTCRIFLPSSFFFFSVSHVKNRFWILILPEVNLNKTVRHEDDSLILFEHKLIYEHEELCTIFNSSEMHNRVAQDHITFYYTTVLQSWQA